MTDIERLIERLEDSQPPRTMEERLKLNQDAAAMLRKVEAQRKELELELWKWPALMNEVRAELKCTQAERQRAQEACEQISAKLEEPCDVCEAHVDQARQLQKALDNMTEEYHHLRAEKASLTATVNDMATMVNEARAKLEKARDGLTLIVTPQCELNSAGAIAYQLIQIARATLEELSPSPEA